MLINFFIIKKGLHTWKKLKAIKLEVGIISGVIGSELKPICCVVINTLYGYVSS